MRRISSPKILWQRAVAVALLLSAVLAVAAVTITALGSSADGGARAGQGASVVAQVVGGVLVFVDAEFSGWRKD
jgi:hypothetical protein